jgi:hypothetical protein
MRKAITGLFVATAFVPLALAGHPPVQDEMETIRVLAHRVETAAAKLHRTAERNRHHMDRREAFALRLLHELEDAAEFFHRRVESRYASYRGTDNDFRRLVIQYRRAAANLNDLHPDRQVWRDWRRLEADMERLMDFYGGRSRWERDGRDDRRRDDDHEGAVYGRYRTRGGGSVGIAVRW